VVLDESVVEIGSVVDIDGFVELGVETVVPVVVVSFVVVVVAKSLQSPNILFSTNYFVINNLNKIILLLMITYDFRRMFTNICVRF